MQNCKPSARTAEQKRTKCRLLFRPAALAAMLMLATVFSSCGYMCGYSVEQEVRQMSYSLETKFVTYVWGNGKIIQVWYDPIDSVNSSLVKRRQLQGDSLVAALKNSR